MAPGEWGCFALECGGIMLLAKATTLIHHLDWFYNPVTQVTLVFSDILRIANLRGVQPVAQSLELDVTVSVAGKQEEEEATQ